MPEFSLFPFTDYWWFYALFTGNLHSGLRDVLAYWLRYNAQSFGYICLLTQRYPSFSDE